MADYLYLCVTEFVMFPICTVNQNGEFCFFLEKLVIIKYRNIIL